MAGSTTTATVGGLAASTTYDFQVVAVNEIGESTPSVLATATTAVFGSPIAGTSVTITGQTPGTAFTFQVLAINANGTAASATVALSTTAPPTNPPTSLTASAGTPAYSVAALSWTPSAVDGTHGAAATYQPQYELASGGGWVNFGSPVTGA